MNSTPSSVGEVPTGAWVFRPVMLVRLGLALLLAAAIGEWLGFWHVYGEITQLPALCLFRRVTGWECPGCGMGRALAFLAGAEFHAAGQQHPFVLPFLLWMTVWAAVPERRLRPFLDRFKVACRVVPASACLGLTGWWFLARVV